MPFAKVENAKKNLITVPRVGTTILMKSSVISGKSTSKPASEGTGLRRRAARAVLELAGIGDILTKSLGSNTPINVVNATFEGLKQLKTAEEVAKLRGKTVEELLG